MDYIKLMLLSMVPVIELRGAIPLGIVAMDLNPLYLYISCLIGSSLVSIPVVLIFIGNAIAGVIILGLSLHISQGSIEMIIASLLLVLVGIIAYMCNKRKQMSS